MYTELNRQYKCYLFQIENTLESLNQISTQSEIEGFRQHLIFVYNKLRERTLSKIEILDLKHDSLLPDLINNAYWLSEKLHQYNSCYLPTLYRINDDDKVVLKVINWLHNSNQVTNKHPFTISDDSFLIYPNSKLPIKYCLPHYSSSQLLYLPLLFHEYGHLLFDYKQIELNDLVKEFQEYVYYQLSPKTIRNLSNETFINQERYLIANLWAPWLQELFCDIIGFIIGGLYFVNAFQLFFLLNSASSYYKSREKLINPRSTHPIPWLRAKTLARYMERNGLTTNANELLEIWGNFAQIQSINEDYHGTWKNSFIPKMDEIIDCMIEEVQPLKFDQLSMQIDDVNQINNPIDLLNLAWKKFMEEPEDFMQWEKDAIKIYSQEES